MNRNFTKIFLFFKKMDPKNKLELAPVQKKKVYRISAYLIQLDSQFEAESTITNLTIMGSQSRLKNILWKMCLKVIEAALILQKMVQIKACRKAEDFLLSAA